MDKTKQNRFDWHLKQIGLFIISFITIFIWVLLGYIIAIIPSCEWFSFKSVSEWILSLKLLDVLQWIVRYLIPTGITGFISWKVFKQW